MQVHRQCTASLPKEERELRDSALYVVENLGMVRLALQLCDFRDVSLSVEAKHVRNQRPLLPLPSSRLRPLFLPAHGLMLCALLSAASALC